MKAKKQKINEENLDDFTTQRQSDELSPDDYEAEKNWKADHRLIIDWLSLRSGPMYFKLADPSITAKDLNTIDSHKFWDLKPDEELMDLEKRFWKQLGSRDSFTPEKMKKFATDNGWEVVWSVYDTTGSLYESMSEDEEKSFRKAMKEGPVEFKYEKVDGTVRKAKGTLKEDLMDLPAEASGKNVEAVAKKKHFVPPTVFVYWDLEAGGFRSFRKANFISWKKA